MPTHGRMLDLRTPASAPVLASIACLVLAFQLYGGAQAVTPLQLARLLVQVYPQRHGMPCKSACIAE